MEGGQAADEYVDFGAGLGAGVAHAALFVEEAGEEEAGVLQLLPGA